VQPSIAQALAGACRGEGTAAPRTRTRPDLGPAAAASLCRWRGAAWTLIAREEPPWNELPSAPAGNVSVTPVPISPPSEEVLAALLAGPSDEALFAEAKSALERGDLQGSRSALMALLERDPDFPGAQALLEQVEAERRKAAERRRRPAEVEPELRPVATEPSDAELFAEAEYALARGELAVSQTKLDALLKINPGYSGLAELKERLERRIWTTTLPKSVNARHNHRIGGCDGVLSLTFEGLSFRSNDHEWAWAYGELSRWIGQCTTSTWSRPRSDGHLEQQAIPIPPRRRSLQRHGLAFLSSRRPRPRPDARAAELNRADSRRTSDSNPAGSGTRTRIVTGV
jgi:hypothetical protein